MYRTIVKYVYDVYDEEGVTILRRDERIITYSYEMYAKKLTVSNNLDQSISINDVDKMDINDIGCEIALKALLPDEIDELGAPISFIEDYIIKNFIKNKDTSNINNAVFEVNYVPDFVMKLTLNNGKTIIFPQNGSEYFEFNFEAQLL